jgi:hypothetical protein
VEGQRVSQTPSVLEGRTLAGASAAKREVRVVARGRSPRQAIMRSTLMAAVATCCKWGLANPRYRVRRRPKARTPGERVPSMPARHLSPCRPSSLAYQVRAAWRASYGSCGGRWRRRPVDSARGQRDRATQSVQSCVRHATIMPGRSRVRSTWAAHMAEHLPWGQVTTCRSQSTVNWSMV